MSACCELAIVHKLAGAVYQLAGVVYQLAPVCQDATWTDEGFTHMYRWC